jgi:hypothetical protein
MEDSLMAVGIAGDWHGNTGHALRAMEQFRRLGLRYVFQLGDFGLWGGLLEHNKDKLRSRLQIFLEKHDMMLFVTLGNHEKYSFLPKFSIYEDGPWKGFLYEPKAPRVLYFQRGQSIRLGGRNLLSIGGAASIDFKYRMEGLTIWKEERISAQDVRNTIEEADRLGEVDVILAHDVFASAPIFGTHRQSDKWDAEEKAYAQTSRDALEKVVQAVTPKLWLHGHYHLPITTEVEMQSTKVVKDAKGRMHRTKATIKTHCLAMDGKPQSTGILWLELLELEYLPNLKA